MMHRRRVNQVSPLQGQQQDDSELPANVGVNNINTQKNAITAALKYIRRQHQLGWEEVKIPIYRTLVLVR